MLWLWALALAMILLGWRLWRQGRAARLVETVGRSHDNPAKCGRCGFRGGCDQALA